ncbi:MAG TPA: 16S rRNA (uracil(1498)-N(3))-methyltransferase [Acetivibrio sp.]|uniref:16S rRNA (uracil(1498)-N(3))-methyltransferase n=1 Tax=Acetivibrio sp. TaxID=1872092 RepID=UPI002C7B631D|nr:16S rRNA (uracil(1498)-N(3))-methyltransferase [Acetivibrio sp.]HOM02458.1 16S rRNA (uracil(1498)-N(3))-methyltransferase [Acetivibrio sp.]
MPRFFVRKSDVSGDSINISGEDFNHIKKVLRLGNGDRITVCDGEGTDYLVEIMKFEDASVKTRIIESMENFTEPPVKITLFQGLPKSDKMDYIIQKAVELGIYEIVPVITERTVVKTDKKSGDKKCERWNRISMEAAKQCNRGIIPKVGFPISFKEALNAAKGSSFSLIPYEKETGIKLKEVLSKKSSAEKVSVFIGPEGGFSQTEIETAISCGIQPVTLGPRILRTETAGIAVLSILMYELGDVGV